MFEKKMIENLASTISLSTSQVHKVLELIVENECTVPFVARYRKEVTGNLDEVQIREVISSYETYIELEKRRSFILETVKKIEALTPLLEKSIQNATTIEQLEDLYAPFKSKKKSKGMVAKEAGLEPLANLFLNGHMTLEQIKENFKLPEGITSFSDALNGAKDIITELISHHLETKESLRNYYWDKAILQSTKRNKADEIENVNNFKDFFEFKEEISKLKSDKNSHRYLAMRRGMNLKILKLDIVVDEMIALDTIKSLWPSLQGKSSNIIKECLVNSYKTYIHPSLDLEIKTELKKFADETAIKIFSTNLKNLLLSPYLGAKAVMGVDPGIRTGSKIVIIDSSSKLLVDFVIHPHGSPGQISEAIHMITKTLDHFKIEYIAIGNGTYGRETLAFFEDSIPAVTSGKIKATLISESGASVYSASPIARAEFPDKDTTVRGAVSIARRFQDPLAEVVKIDPKSIGVGQYQHDVNESKLKKSLNDVVESCVNYVGVDLNTASAPLLSFISGIGPKLAENIVNHRQEKGKFLERKQLLTVSRFTQKVFEQSVGFLRIYEGQNPLDATFIHPEKYEFLETWAKTSKIELSSLVADSEIQKKLEKDKELSELIGTYTFKDILQSLKAPAQDPRTVFKSAEFSKKLREFKDLIINEWYTGIVNNITQFGAFVDIGIKESGLLHISEIADEFVENPMSKLHVGQEVKVRVVAVDNERKRISLSCKKGNNNQGNSAHSKISSSSSSSSSSTGKSTSSLKPSHAIKNNPFEKLKNLSLKK